MDALELTSTSPGYTRRLGTRLGELAQPGDVYLLMGPLGSGKTCLVQGLAWGLGIPGFVASASFVLMAEHQGRLPLYHIDLYRLEETVQAADLGLDEYLYGHGVCAVEWADRALSVFPPERLDVFFSHAGPRRRHLRFAPQGERYRELVDAIGQWVKAAKSPVSR